jgi:trimeric autotransporter adhesin
MPGFALRPLVVAVCAGLLLTTGASALLAQEKVGINSAVNTEATGVFPGAAAPRRLVIGQDVIFNEHITTGEGGQTQLLFLDESSMSVGPNSEITIDQFVYDPKSGTGKLAMSATRGLLRYVGGKLSKQDDAVTLRTATATLAVRGGAFVGQIDRNGKTTAAFLYGKGLTVTGGAGGAETLTRPGFETIVLPGGRPSPPGPMPPGLLALFVQQLDGRSGGTGGATNIPTDGFVANSGISQTISGDFNQSLRQAGQNQGYAGGSAWPPNLTPPTTVTSTVASTANQVPACSLQNTCPPGTPPGTTTSNQVVVTTTGPYAGALKSVDFFGNLPDQSSSANVPFSSAALSNGTFATSVGGSVLSFPLATGTTTFTSAGSSSAGPLSGTSFLSNDGAFFYANLNTASGQSYFVSGGLPAPSSALAPTGATRVTAFSLAGAPSPSNIPFSLNDDTPLSPTLTPLYLVAPANTAIGNTSTTSASGNTIAARELNATVTFLGQGSAQSSSVVVQGGIVTTLQSSGSPFISGGVRGVESTSAGGGSETITSSASSVVDGNGNSLYGANGITGFTLDQTKYQTASATSLVATTPAAVQPQASETEGVSTVPNPETFGFAQPAVATTLPTGVGTSRTTQTLTGFFGGTMTTTAQTTPYTITGAASISTDSVANALKATFTSDTLSSSATGGVTSVVMNFGGQQSTFVDDHIFGAFENPAIPQQINGQQLSVGGSTAAASQLYLVSSATGALPTSLLPSGASYCQCQYVQWGYWGGDLLTGDPSTDLTRVDHGHINFWVAGVPTSAADLNTLASQSAVGTYTGHAIGSVYNAGSSYVAAGGFTGTYNFGTQNGTLTISNFDGHTVSATGSAPLSNGQYSFTVAQTGVAGTINGAFYGPKAAETGGNFSVHSTLGPTYLASGIFAGKQ